MRNPLVILVLCLCSLTNAVPLGLKKNMAIMQEQEDPMLMMATDEETRPELMISRLNLPSNATSIRADITDGFSCDNKTYGYYADVGNDCQIFHVCLPVTYADGKENTFRWSFICPEETVFSQEYFTCMRSEDMSIDCEESFKYYELNRNFGMIEPEEVPADEDEEEMNMDEMSRQPSLGDEETNKPSVEGVPVKKQTVKVPNSNRRKTQANRISIEAQRKKVQPLKRLPKPVVTATTAKPVVEESPIVEQEVERTTIKYQRLTKRPPTATAVPEQPKPEEPKPEKEIVRQDLFAQKRKRPQIFFPSRFDATVQADSESQPLPYLRTDILLQKPEPEPVVPNQAAEAQAQASEINVVSVKPHDELKSVLPERTDAVPIEKKVPAPVFVPVKEETQSIIEEPKTEISSLPENIPSRVEVVEIPIQKINEPVVAEGSAVLAPIPEVPAPLESNPIAIFAEEPIKAGEAEIPAEESLLKKIVAQATENIVESEKPSVDEEKKPSVPVLEPELVSLDEPAESLQNLKSAELPRPAEPEKILESSSETKVQVPEQAPASEEIPSTDKAEESIDEVKPEVSLKVETPVFIENKPEEVLIDSKLKDLPKPILRVEEPALVGDQTPEEPQETQSALKFNALAPEIPEHEPEKPKDVSENAKLQVTEPEILEAQPEKLLEVEAPASEPQVVPKSEIPVVRPVEPLVAEVSSDTQLRDESSIISEQPPAVEIPVAQVDLATPVDDSVQNEEKPVEVEAYSSNEEVAKVVESVPEVKLELPVETNSKPSESLIEPVNEVSPQQLFSSKVEAEEKIPEAESEKEIEQAATENEEAQSLILDFISSLVNSENSNFEDQSAIIKEMSSDSLPEASIPEPVVAEAKPEPEPEHAKIQSQDDQINPLYIPMMPSNDQMYQIPVQVIETPEPEPVPEVPVPAAEPKLPLSVDDVVELVKESLDAPAEKESLVQQPSNDDPSSQPDSEEVKPIYHRYIELGSNLLKSEALTASDDEPVVVPTANEEPIAEKQEDIPELPKTSEKLAEPETLSSKPEALSEVQAVESEKLEVEEKPESQVLLESPKEGRSLNRFKMDPRKRRFLFRSDVS